jgi:RimJ/RimL family protein N-acetyltransferase
MQNPYIIGNRYYLRHPTLQDAEGSWHEWFSDPLVTQFLIDRNLPNSIENQVGFYKSLSTDASKVVLSICSLEDDKHVGVCSLSSINWFHRFGDLSIVLDPSYKTDPTCAIEALSLLLEIAFLRLNLLNIKSIYVSSNVHTHSLMHFFGFRDVGVMTKIVFCSGSYHDLTYAQLSREDWASFGRGTIGNVPVLV